MLSTNLGVAVVLGDMSETPVDQIFKKVCVCVEGGGGGWAKVIIALESFWPGFLAHHTYHEAGDKVCFKRRAIAVPNSIDRIIFDFSMAVARRLKPSRATQSCYRRAELNS